MRLFNEPKGRQYLASKGVPESLVSQLDLLGFSGIANMLSAIKFAKWNELGKNDIVLCVLTDSMQLYGSRMIEMRESMGEFTSYDAAEIYNSLQGVTTDAMEELSYPERKRVHNLKYFTWVEQQGKSYKEIQEQWYDPNYWTDFQAQLPEIDALITEFNDRVGLIKSL